MTHATRSGALRSRRRAGTARATRRLFAAAAATATIGVACVVGSFAMPTAEASDTSATAIEDLAQAEAQGYGTSLVSGPDADRDDALSATAIDPNNPDEMKAIAAGMLADYGWDESEMSCLDSLWMKESGWNPFAENPDSGAYGIPQSWPAEKMATAGDDWRTNPVTQIRWGLDYIQRAYGSPCTVWNGYTNWY
ncbi:MAG: transglycosylase SLT domain-containing protein [Pseudoclavibacter sp.]